MERFRLRGRRFEERGGQGAVEVKKNKVENREDRTLCVWRRTGDGGRVGRGVSGEERLSDVLYRFAVRTTDTYTHTYTHKHTHGCTYVHTNDHTHINIPVHTHTHTYLGWGWEVLKDRREKTDTLKRQVQGEESGTPGRGWVGTQRDWEGGRNSDTNDTGDPGRGTGGR